MRTEQMHEIVWESKNTIGSRTWQSCSLFLFVLSVMMASLNLIHSCPLQMLVRIEYPDHLVTTVFSLRCSGEIRFPVELCPQVFALVIVYHAVYRMLHLLSSFSSRWRLMPTIIWCSAVELSTIDCLMVTFLRIGRQSSELQWVFGNNVWFRWGFCPDKDW